MVKQHVPALSWLAIAAQVVFVIGWVVGALLEPTYSPVRSFVSELGRKGAAHPWIFDVSTVVWGLGFVALALAMAPVLSARRWGGVAPSLFVLAGVLAVLLALPLDCSPTTNELCRVRRDAGLLSWHYYVHDWAAIGLSIALLLTPLALARSLWPGLLARLMLFGTLLLCVLLAALLLANARHGSMAGFWQRIELLIVHAWVIACAGVLIIGARPRPYADSISSASASRGVPSAAS